jgi:hypothetical protein
VKPIIYRGNGDSDCVGRLNSIPSVLGPSSSFCVPFSGDRGTENDGIGDEEIFLSRISSTLPPSSFSNSIR